MGRRYLPAGHHLGQVRRSRSWKCTIPDPSDRSQSQDHNNLSIVNAKRHCRFFMLDDGSYEDVCIILRSHFVKITLFSKFKDNSQHNGNLGKI